jgi:hypothetical protein
MARQSTAAGGAFFIDDGHFRRAKQSKALCLQLTSLLGPVTKAQSRTSSKAKAAVESSNHQKRSGTLNMANDEPETHPAAPKVIVPIQTNGIASEETGGVRQTQSGFKPPQPMPGMLNKEMAEAAAKKYTKDKKKIQKACAKLEPGGDKSSRCSCCVVM